MASARCGPVVYRIVATGLGPADVKQIAQSLENFP